MRVDAALIARKLDEHRARGHDDGLTLRELTRRLGASESTVKKTLTWMRARRSDLVVETRASGERGRPENTYRIAAVGEGQVQRIQGDFAAMP